MPIYQPSCTACTGHELKSLQACTMPEVQHKKPRYIRVEDFGIFFAGDTVTQTKNIYPAITIRFLRKINDLVLLEVHWTKKKVTTQWLKEERITNLFVRRVHPLQMEVIRKPKK